MKIFSKILIIFLSLNIIFTSLYPALLVTVAYGYEVDWEGNPIEDPQEEVSETVSEQPVQEEQIQQEEQSQEESPVTEMPVQEEQTQQENTYQQSFDEQVWQDYVQNTYPALVQPSDVSQDPTEDNVVPIEVSEETSVTEEVQPVLTDQQQFDAMMEQAQVQAELLRIQEAQEAYERQQAEEVQQQEWAQNAVSFEDTLLEKSAETIAKTGENMSNLYSSAYERLLQKQQEEAEQKRMMEELGIVEQTAQRSQEQYIQDIQKAIDAPVEERVAVMRESLGLPAGTSDESVKNTFQQAAKDIGINVTMDGDIDNFTVTLTPEEIDKQMKDAWILTGEVAAGTAALITAPIWIPAAAVGVGTATTAVSTAGTATYVYATSAGSVLLANSPRIIQAGVGLLAKTSDIVVPAATWAACQGSGNPTACVEENLLNVPAITEVAAVEKNAGKVLSATEDAIVDAAIKLSGGGLKSSGAEILEGAEQVTKKGLWEGAVDTVGGWFGRGGKEVAEEGVESVLVRSLDEENSIFALTERRAGQEVFVGSSTTENTLLRDVAAEAGVSEAQLAEYTNKAETLLSHLKENNGKVELFGSYLSEADKEAWSALRFNGDLDASVVAGIGKIGSFDEASREALMDSIIRAQIVQKKNYDQILKPELQVAEDIITQLKNKAIDAGVDPNKLQSSSKVFKAEKFFVGDVPSGALGSTEPITQDVVVGAQFLDDQSATLSHILIHECAHRGCALNVERNGVVALEDQLMGDIQREITKVNEQISQLDLFDSGSAAAEQVLKAKRNALYDVQFNTSQVENARRLREGLTEWLTEEAKGMVTLTGKEVNLGAGSYYVEEVEGVKEIINTIVASGVPLKEAEGMALEAALTGDASRMIKAVGGSQGMVEILGNIVIPEGSTNRILKQVSKIITPADIAVAEAKVLKDLEGGVGAVKGLKTQSYLPFSLIGLAFAADLSVQPATINSQDFELLVKKQLIKNALAETGEVDSDFVKDVLKTEIIKPEVNKIDSGYEFVTGKAGTTEGDIEEGVYTVSVSSLPDKDIIVPEMITITKGSNIALPIKVKKGSGKVEKENGIKGKSTGNNTKISVAIVSENNQVLPWAGMNIALTKVVQEKGISLNNGWNLVTLTALPTQAMTASTLISEIAKQGGYATTVSSLENGFWKSYVIRGDKTYSGEDFAIEPGKAYFVKAEKRSTFTFEGQNFVAPVKLKLASGWNAVGVPKASKSYKASGLIEALNNSKLPSDAAARWESGLWDTLVKKQNEDFGENFVIANNRGYLVRLEQGGEFSP